uniref:FI21262p1 n=1 Tax=Drosophila melanogaster TaxID=7227 RepID=Q9W3N0_DROME|nr:snazarus, isoform B [Drosophila melanogaster]NP_572421.1 snazarus, isoform A [Drosophila melanogaster]AAF46292.2 snazarus, isoform A [Drosophila melanogaster]AGV77148.1 FI21262p1 [Drosophila melanogaster]AHN59464.1 snazarus, isoform B [Drosophila melanogaster]|eukprot:NP_001284993.1 snazarus, isoform B [Drosophila melanogaster]
MESEEHAVDAMENRRLPLFPIEPEPSVTATQRLTLLATRLLRALQLNWRIIVSGITLTLLAVIWYYPTFFLFFAFVVYSLVLVFAAVAGTVYIHYIFTTNEPTPPSRVPSRLLYNATKSNIFDLPKPIKNPSNLPLIFGKTVDLQLQQIIEYVLRDFMLPWLGYVVTKPKLINDVVREDLWNAIQKIHERALRMDAAKIIAVDMVNRVTVHLEKIRIAEARAAETNTPPVFSTNSYLADEEKEMEFLRKLCEIMVILLLPRGYSLPPLKVLLSEILSYKIFFPMIKMLTAPDYINQKVVQNIETRLAAAAMSKRSYEYAASFEDFLKIINNSGNLEELSLIRKSIVNDLMHATTMQNLQRAKGLDPDHEDHSLSKSELTAAVRLKRYVRQLTMAKGECEKNLAKFGWNGNYSSDIDLTLVEILNTAVGRRYFTLFLEPLKASALIGFYLAVEEIKHAHKSASHQLGTEIFYTYIRVPKSEIQIDKHERKLIETFLLGDAEPDIFYDIQRNVLRTLEEKYYPPFVLSDQYRQLKEALDSNEIADPTLLMCHTIGDVQEPLADEQPGAADGLNGGAGGAIDVAAHTSYARRKLEQIQERIDKKNQALDALKYSVKPESKVLTILEKEMEWLKSEKRQTEAHLRRTDAWTEHLGKWKATIQSVEVSDEKESLQFMILVHVDEDINAPVQPTSSKNGDSGHANLRKRPSGISSGWVVMRSLNQVHELQRKLRHVSSNLKAIDLPTNFKFFFLKTDRHGQEKAKSQIQKFLNFILEDDHLNGSEAIYTFLSPSSDHLKQSLPSPKKSKFSLSTLFRSDAGKAHEASKATDPFWGLQRDDEDISTYLDGESGGEAKMLAADLDSKDSIAEPMYALMGEIFDMGGVFKWLRKSLISFVQITYGRTINRQIRESVAYLFEESMLHNYFSAILKSFWPGGVLASAYPTRSEDMREMTTTAAKALLTDHIPEVLCNLVGAQAAKRGVLKVFDALQNPAYNKQLFYELLEILMIEFFPEIRQLRVSNSNGTKLNTATAGAAAASAAAALVAATASASLPSLNHSGGGHSASTGGHQNHQGSSSASGSSAGASGATGGGAASHHQSHYHHGSHHHQQQQHHHSQAGSSK